jgi:2-aminoethylphosphonate-pyruvate transaminase
VTERTVLLNPGPVVLSERVRRALAEPDLCHREPEFAALTLDVRRRLEGLYPEAGGRFEAVVLTGSGTAAVEAMLATLVPKAGRLLVVANGVYGERMASMVRAHGKAVDVVRAEWGLPMDVEGAARRLAADAAITHVAAVHNETTTGRLNDLDALGRLCRRSGRPLLLDAVSSFGAEAIDFEGWNLAAAAGTANKCLHGAPGVSFVLAARGTLGRGASSATALYLDLDRYREQGASGFSPFTLATHVLRALQEALREHEEQGGWSARRELYRRRALRIRAGLAAMGVATYLEPAACSSSITSFRLPGDRTYAELHDGLRERGFVVYAGQGELQREMFRIANMGAIEDADVERLVAALGALLAAGRRA